MGPKKSNSSYTFDRPKTIRDRAKINLADSSASFKIGPWLENISGYSPGNYMARANSSYLPLQCVAVGLSKI